MNWISVEERLPKIGSSGESSIVLVWRPVRKEILLGYYANYIKGYGLWYEHTTGNRIDKPTHWMPLPDPPVEYPSSPQVKRCPICDWPIVPKGEAGCWEGNCSYRPHEGTAEYERIQNRRRIVGSEVKPRTGE